MKISGTWKQPDGGLCVPSKEEASVLDFLLPLSGDYPDIDVWFLSKVLPGIKQQSRKILKIERDNKIVAVGIAKAESDEKKICTVRVHPDFFGRGLGLRIFDTLIEWLEEPKPNLTVSADKVHLFERIFDYYGFEFSGAHQGLYIPGQTELGYNGALSTNRRLL